MLSVFVIVALSVALASLVKDLRTPDGMFSGVLLGIAILVAVFADILAIDPFRGQFESLQPPSH